MKKVLFYAGCAVLMAAMTVSCGNKNAEEEAVDTIVMDTVAEEVVEEEAVAAEAPEATATMSDAEHAAMLDAAREAGRAKCNCYKKDPASVEACIKSILSESYAAYQNNTEFKSTMEAEFNGCVKEKATAAAKEAGDKAVKAGAEALSKKFGNK